MRTFALPTCYAFVRHGVDDYFQQASDFGNTETARPDMHFQLVASKSQQPLSDISEMNVQSPKLTCTSAVTLEINIGLLKVRRPLTACLDPTVSGGSGSGVAALVAVAPKDSS